MIFPFASSASNDEAVRPVSHVLPEFVRFVVEAFVAVIDGVVIAPAALIVLFHPLRGTHVMSALFLLDPAVSGLQRPRSRIGRFGMVALAAGIWAWSSACSLAAESAADDFYRHKTITLIVGTDASGEYDAMARLLARHLGKHIPGNPNIIVENTVSYTHLTLPTIYSV